MTDPLDGKSPHFFAYVASCIAWLVLTLVQFVICSRENRVAMQIFKTALILFIAFFLNFVVTCGRMHFFLNEGSDYEPRLLPGGELVFVTSDIFGATETNVAS